MAAFCQCDGVLEFIPVESEIKEKLLYAVDDVGHVRAHQGRAGVKDNEGLGPREVVTMFKKEKVDEYFNKLSKSISTYYM